ncbi:MAG TPA: LysM domain-containing protein [Anaerolineales bacterium]
MKTFVLALATAILIAGQIFSPAVAAPPSAVLSSGTCGDTYTVQWGEWLAKIARGCGMTLTEVLALNPQIGNPNLIFPGQVLRLNTSVAIPSAPAYYPYYDSWYYPTSSTAGYARVSLSTTQVSAGDKVTVYVSGFKANADIDYRVGLSGESYSFALDGKTGPDGSASRTITIPASADTGDTWVIRVTTTELKVGNDVTSRSIYIKE